MEEPGSRPSKPEAFIKEEARSPVRCGAENLFTIVCWIVYLYLILPFFTMVMWYLGINTFYDQFIGARGYMDLLNIIKDGGLIVIAVLFVMLSWSYYNYLWFTKRGERRGERPVENRELWFAELLNCNVEDLDRIRNLKRIELCIKDPGYRIISKETDK